MIEYNNDKLLNIIIKRKLPKSRPSDTLPEDQMYVVLLCKYSGVQLEEYCESHKLSPDQAHSVVRQICCSLAAAEQVPRYSLKISIFDMSRIT